MKKVFVLLFLLVMLIALPVACLATSVTDTGGDTPALMEYLTPEQFITVAGQIAFVIAVVQLIKLPVDGLIFGHIKTGYVVYIIAFAGQVLSRLIYPATGGLTWSAVPTMLVYAIVVAWGAMKGYDKIIARVEAAKLAAVGEDYVDEPEAKPPNDTAKSETA